MDEMKLHLHQSSGAARLLATLTHITSGLSACAADCLPSMAQSASVHPWTSPNVRLNASPTALARSSRLMVLFAISFHSLA